MSRYNYLWILVIISFNSIIPNTSGTLFIENLTSEGGSTYEYSLDSDHINPSNGISFQQGEDFEIKIGIKVINLASNVNDFHDILLYVRLENNEGLLIDISLFLGKLYENLDNVDALYQLDGTEFQYIDEDSTTKYYTNFNIFVGATFREDVSLQTDPSTDDKWHLFSEVDILPISTDNNELTTTEGALDDRLGISDQITTSTIITTSVPPSPEAFPFTILAIILLFAIIGGAIFLNSKKSVSKRGQGIISNKMKKNEFVQSRQITRNQPGFNLDAKLCPSCGTMNVMNSQFCIECGLHLK